MPYRQYPAKSQTDLFHVFSRGNEKRLIFKEPNDYQRFISKLETYSANFQTDVLTFCLMPNHYHILIKQVDLLQLTEFVHRLNLSHAMFFNKKYQRVGHLFQGPFCAKPIDSEPYLIKLSAYIHGNPLKLGEDPFTYPWSSLALLDQPGSFLKPQTILSYFDSTEGYYLFLRQALGLSPGLAAITRRPAPR